MQAAIANNERVINEKMTASKFSGIGKKLIFIGLTGLFACAPALYLPTSEIAGKHSKGLDDLNHGRQIYIDHCGSCHHLYQPGQYTEQVWSMHVNEMQSRAKISNEQKQLILDYILSGK